MIRATNSIATLGFRTTLEMDHRQHTVAN